HRSIAGVPHFAGGGERNEDGAIVAGEVIAQLQLALHDADDGKADAVNLNFFAHGRPSAKQLLADAPANECDAAVFHYVSGVEPAAFGWDFVAHLAVSGTNATDRGIRKFPAISNGKRLDGLKARRLHQRCVLADLFQISQFKADAFAGALSSGLFAGLSGPADYRALAEGFKGMDQD